VLASWPESGMAYRQRTVAEDITRLNRKYESAMEEIRFIRSSFTTGYRFHLADGYFHNKAVVIMWLSSPWWRCSW